MHFLWLLPLFLGRLETLSAKETIVSTKSEPSPFLNDILDNVHTGYKDTGESCDTAAIKPCQDPNDVCEGQPPKCTSRNKPKKVEGQAAPHFEDIYGDVVIEDTEEEIPKKHIKKHFIAHGKSLNKTNKKGRTRGSKSGRKGVGRTLPLDEPDFQIGKDTDLNKEIAEPSHGPPFKGNLTWDGKPGESDITCIFDYKINQVFYDRKKTSEEKENWALENMERICDFDNFQVCVSDFDELHPPEVGEEIEEDPFEEEDSSDKERGSCKCLEHTNVLINGYCYIPANNGTRSSCGKTLRKIYPPVPDWTGIGPDRIQNCTPNAVCDTSLYWFGLRCTCKPGFRWIRLNSTCEDENATEMFDLIDIWKFRTFKESVAESNDTDTDKDDDDDDDSRSRRLIPSNNQVFVLTTFSFLIIVI